MKISLYLFSTNSLYACVGDEVFYVQLGTAERDDDLIRSLVTGALFKDGTGIFYLSQGQHHQFSHRSTQYDTPDQLLSQPDVYFLGAI